MKNLPTYENFLKENYLPYFGVKQALDDSKQFITNEEKLTDFHRIYSMTSTWWNIWKKENEGNYEIEQDAFTKTYSVKKDGKSIFVFDYSRNKIFTNERPEFFVVDEPTHSEYEDAKDIEVENPEAKKEEPKKPEKKEDEKSDNI
jgi:hypothetical protein